MHNKFIYTGKSINIIIVDDQKPSSNGKNSDSKNN
mgnify:CR=1 FL=1